MKRIALLLTIVNCLLCNSIYAQLNITAAVDQAPERIMNGQLSYSWLYKTGSGNYEYWARTDNQFDQHYTTLFLGNTPEAALLTLNDLKSLMEKEVAGVAVQQEGGDVVLSFHRQLGARMLWIHQTGQAGKSWISLQIVEKFIKYFEKEIQTRSRVQEQVHIQDDEELLWD